MKLTELNPRWIHENVFIFLCPHCRRRWISCKNVVMGTREQMELFEQAVKDELIETVVPMRSDVCWNISGKDFDTMTVTPSIDASPSGDWHGFITGGYVV